MLERGERVNLLPKRLARSVVAKQLLFLLDLGGEGYLIVLAIDCPAHMNRQCETASLSLMYTTETVQPTAVRDSLSREGEFTDEQWIQRPNQGLPSAQACP